MRTEFLRQLEGALAGNPPNIESIKDLITGKYICVSRSNEIEFLKEILSYECLKENPLSLELKSLLVQQKQTVIDNEADALFNRAEFHRNGAVKGIKPNYNIALSLYRRALDLHGIAKKDELSFDSFKAKVFSQIGLMVFNGHGTENGDPDYKWAYFAFRSAAIYGDREHFEQQRCAANKEADRYYLGIGQEGGIPNDTFARTWLNCGYGIQARIKLARMAMKGHGEKEGKPNYPEAIRLLDKVSDCTLDYAYIFIERAKMYSKGYCEKDGKPNYPKAIELYNKALKLDKDNKEAMDELAKIYAAGHGDKSGKPNYSVAISLLKKSGSELAEMLLIEYERAKVVYEKWTNSTTESSDTEFFGFFHHQKSDGWKLNSVLTKTCLGKLD